MIALIDCNSFFCSCERLFRPDVAHRPVGVLSNNDGCFVSLTPELKALGVKMGDPYFKVKDLCRKHNVAVFSSNFSLYTNLSDRVMLTLSDFSPELEIYSVDEAFLNLSGFDHLEKYGRQIKSTVERYTGIPVSVGIAPTKTLAKIANHIAKRSKKSGGVVDLSEPKHRDTALSRVAVGDIWGIGPASAEKLNRLGITTAKQFRDFDHEPQIRKIFTKVGLKTQEELKGLPRFSLEKLPPKKKEIICSRTFGTPVFDVNSLRESVANYVTSACEKLRNQDSVCSSVEVYTRTSPFKHGPQYYGYKTATLLSATSDTRKVIRYALQALDSLYRAGYEYKKAGVKLTHIVNEGQGQTSFWESPDTEKTKTLMKQMDNINAREGSGTLKPAVCGTHNHAWAMNRKLKSPRFVTGWSELKKVS
jgi:DNA polymerase V